MFKDIGVSPRTGRRVAWSTLKGRITRAVPTSVAILSCSLALNACGPSASSYAHKACQLVNKSIAIYTNAEHYDAPKQAAAYDHALSLLRNALPDAALAAGTDNQWQALQATLSESDQVPESRLIASLKQQCSSNSSQLGEYVPPSTTP